MPVSPALVEQIRHELRNAPHGHKSVIAKRWAAVLDCSVQQVYRLAADGKKSARSSKAKKPDYHEWAKVVMMVKKRPPEGAGEISTDQAIEIAAAKGLIPLEALSVPIGTFDRIIRSFGVTKRKRRFTRYQAEKPNQAHHVDASSSKFFFVHRRVGNDYVIRLHRPGANGYKNKPIPCDRLRPWIYGLVDDHSGRQIARYTIAAGESMADTLLFLQHAWSAVGLPEQLIADQGVLKKGLPSQDLIKRLDVALPEMMPYEKEAHGKIERPWRTAWQRFEKPFFAVDDWQKYEITEAELNRRFAVYLEEYNELPHRFEHGLIEFCFVGTGGNFEPLPQERDLLMLHAEFEHGAVRNRDHGGLGFFDLAASELDQLLPQSLELGLVGLEAAQIGCGVGADGNRFEHLGRIGQREARIEILAESQRLEAPAPRILGIVEHRIAHLRFGVGEPIGGLRVGAIEAPGIG